MLWEGRVVNGSIRQRKRMPLGHPYDRGYVNVGDVRPEDGAAKAVPPTCFTLDLSEGPGKT